MQIERCPKCDSFVVFHCVRGKGQRITGYGPRCENPRCEFGKRPLLYFRRKRDAIAYWNALTKGKEATMPSPELSPRPWRIESDNLTLRPPVCFVVDANGAKVSGGFFSPADAALIVAAVNEREHLRAQIAATVSEALAIREERDRLRDALKRIIDATYDIDKGCQDFRAIARAALEEDKE